MHTYAALLGNRGSLQRGPGPGSYHLCSMMTDSDCGRNCIQMIGYCNLPVCFVLVSNLHPIQPGGLQERMQKWGYVSMVLYTIGLPVFFSRILYSNRAGIIADQRLRKRNSGMTKSTNPNIHIRTRYEELYRFGVGAVPQFALLIRKATGEPKAFIECVLVSMWQLVPAGSICLAARAHAAKVLHCCRRAHVQLLSTVPSMVS